MVLGSVLGIRHRGSYLDAADAARISRQARGTGRARMILLNLRETTETTTAALAKLILLRSRLIRSGCDLRIVGLTGKADALYRVERMERILPRRQHHRGDHVYAE